MLAKQILQFMNDNYINYNIIISPNNVINLPEYLYSQDNFLLNIGNNFPVPTNVELYEDDFTMIASFNGNLHTILIPYTSLLGIFEYEMKNGILFTQYKGELPNETKPKVLN